MRLRSTIFFFSKPPIFRSSEEDVSLFLLLGSKMSGPKNSLVRHWCRLIAILVVLLTITKVDLNLTCRN